MTQQSTATDGPVWSLSQLIRCAALYTKTRPSRTRSQQVLEVRVVLVRHILQAVLAVDLGARLVEVLAHRVIDQVSWQAELLALVPLLLDQPGDVEDLGDDDHPEDDPDYEDALEGVDLDDVLDWVAEVSKQEHLRIAAQTWS